MPVNIYERAIQPTVDLDTGVVVYVPGYADMGPGEPTLVDSSNFTALFGSRPYVFKTNHTDGKCIGKNVIYANGPDRSWLYAKGLVDAGLTVLFHRVWTNGELSDSAYAINSTGFSISTTGFTKYKIRPRAKYFGNYYNKLSVRASQSSTGATTFEVRDKKGELLESAVVSFDPAKTNFIGDTNFSYIDLLVYDTEAAAYVSFTDTGLAAYYSNSSYAPISLAKASGDWPTLELVYSGKGTENVSANQKPEDEFDPSKFIEMLSAMNDDQFIQLKDSEVYDSISYLTTGGYYFTKNTDMAAMQKLAHTIKAVALIDYASSSVSSVSSLNTLSTLKTDLLGSGASNEERAKSAMFKGADTYYISGYRVVIGDSYGYLERLGNNIKSGIPYWIPVANNPQGVTTAVATTCPINYTVREGMVSEDGVSINPIIYKRNAGYTIMGNRTLCSLDGVAGPDAFLNCQLVVNAVLRAARRSANKLLIVSTSISEAFSTFKTEVSKTCEKMLVNRDGLAAYNITRLKKTKPATIDVLIQLTVVEGIETFNINLNYQLELEA